MLREIKIPHINEEELTPLVKALLSVISECMELIQELREENQRLRDELARIKGGNPKPKIQPSLLEKDISPNKSRDIEDVRKWRRKRKKNRKKKKITIHEEKDIKMENAPDGSQFKGYKGYTVQDIIMYVHNIRYRRERWKTPDGRWLIAPLPPGVEGHYGASLRQYILHLNYEMNVPQDVILRTLTERGIKISAGELNNILTNRHALFDEEIDQIFETGKNFFPYLSVDDTGARHKGKNGFCTHIGNEFFSYFKSTESKSRLNFLKILRGNRTDYIFTDESFEYMRRQGLAEDKYNHIYGANGRRFADDKEWNDFLKMTGIRADKDIRTVTEAALLGSLLYYGMGKDTVILSDDAGQFDILLLHALCWLHAERKLAVIIPINDYQAKVLDDIRSSVWNFYRELKDYKMSPDEEKIQLLEEKFDAIFTQKTDFESINKALRLIYEDKRKLLLVLKRPEIPLHNNVSENPMRIMVTKRKVNGGTRSDDGRRSRDTYVSLLKTCRKLGILFSDYLLDRLMGSYNIRPLHEIMIEAFSAKYPSG